ncbi:hypothetical protein KAW48_07820 [candidate division WOR-3 bacterium]|nr:hypothetical protein [candidate division WOR-3 bacterium]
MSEKEYQPIHGHKTILAKGPPPGKEEHDGEFFAVHVRSESDDCNSFSEVIHVSDFVWVEAEKNVREWYPEYAENWKEFLEENIWFDTHRRAKERFESDEYEEGEFYLSMKITVDNFEPWLNKVQLLIDA